METPLTRKLIMNLRKYILLILLLPCVAFANQNWQIAGVTKTQAVLFLKTLQKYAKTNNRKAIANLVRYPLRHPRRHREILNVHDPIKGPNEFLQQYNQIMTKKVLNAIKYQKPNKLFTNYQGVMIGSGEVWFTEVGSNWTRSIKIIAINH